ncbi:hypothetical protein [Streptomyces turgidiscabies]|uniref:hypothetical protein n=1 Tax=Streptomyces turgidiscabies TaxID=85558 RepID=UPI0038F777E3
MKDTIYLTVDAGGVKKMTKSLPYMQRGEYPIKLEVEVSKDAFRNPTITRKVVVNDWREGIDIQDVDFKETFITEDEAKMVRQQRLAKMRQILEAQGFVVSAPEVDAAA